MNSFRRYTGSRGEESVQHLNKTNLETDLDETETYYDANDSFIISDEYPNSCTNKLRESNSLTKILENIRDPLQFRSALRCIADTAESLLLSIETAVKGSAEKCRRSITSIMTPKMPVNELVSSNDGIKATVEPIVVNAMLTLYLQPKIVEDLVAAEVSLPKENAEKSQDISTEPIRTASIVPPTPIRHINPKLPMNFYSDKDSGTESPTGPLYVPKPVHAAPIPVAGGMPYQLRKEHTEIEYDLAGFGKCQNVRCRDQSILSNQPNKEPHAGLGQQPTELKQKEQVNGDKDDDENNKRNGSSTAFEFITPRGVDHRSAGDCFIDLFNRFPNKPCTHEGSYQNKRDSKEEFKGNKMIIIKEEKECRQEDEHEPVPPIKLPCSCDDLADVTPHSGCKRSAKEQHERVAIDNLEDNGYHSRKGSSSSMCSESLTITDICQAIDELLYEQTDKVNSNTEPKNISRLNAVSYKERNDRTRTRTSSPIIASTSKHRPIDDNTIDDRAKSKSNLSIGSRKNSTTSTNEKYLPLLERIHEMVQTIRSDQQLHPPPDVNANESKDSVSARSPRTPSSSYVQNVKISINPPVHLYIGPTGTVKPTRAIDRDTSKKTISITTMDTGSQSHRVEHNTSQGTISHRSSGEPHWSDARQYFDGVPSMDLLEPPVRDVDERPSDNCQLTKLKQKLIPLDWDLLRETGGFDSNLDALRRKRYPRMNNIYKMKCRVLPQRTISFR